MNIKMPDKCKRYFAETGGVRVSMCCSKTSCKGIISISSDMKNKISAVHIHKNVNGKAGPITLWLATTPEWEVGVMQNTPLANAPCCNNRMCNANSPPGTFMVSEIAGRGVPFEFNFDFRNCQNAMCDYLKDFDKSFLNVHGKNFQTIINGCPSNQNPGLDTIDSVMIKPL